MRRVIIFRPNQDAISGRLIKMGDDGLTVLTAQREERIPFDEVSRIVMTGESRSSKGALYGAVLGGYASALIFGTARSGSGYSSPTGYVQQGFFSGLGMLLILTPSILAGGGIGYLIDPGSDGKEEMFDFTGSEESRSAERKRLKNTMNNVEPVRNFHVSLQGSQVNPSVIQQDQTNSMYGGNGYSDVSSFTLLRKLQVTYSVLPYLEMGVASVWFGEPSQNKYISDYNAQTTISTWATSTVTLDAVGRYVVGVFKPFYGSLDRQYDIALGGGVGLASISYKRETQVNTFSTFAPTTSKFEISETMLSGFVYGQASMELTEGLSIGLFFDYVIAPSREATPDPQFQKGMQTLNFGNSSYGFTLGLDF